MILSRAFTDEAPWCSQSTVMIEYTVYMHSRMLGMIINHMMLSRCDIVSSLLCGVPYDVDLL